MKIYTKTGDKGQTSLYDGVRIDKDSLRVESYGTIDELNSYLGFAKNYVKDDEIKSMIKKIQTKLFSVAGELATYDSSKFSEKINQNDILELEQIIDIYINKLDKVDKFILPGSNFESGSLHVARTVCRRAERIIIALKKKEEVNSFLLKYINRLSDVIYAFARYCETELNYFNIEK